MDGELEDLGADIEDLRSPVSLSPLLVDEVALRAEFKRRRSPTILKDFHPADVGEMAAEGWSTFKVKKKAVTMSRPKAHDVLLEDRAWCLFKGMGYGTLNGGRFNIEFLYNAGGVGRKQIDVYAADEETVIISECKSKESRGRKSLDKDIKETIFLQSYIRNSIYSLYDGKPKPKIIWLYITNNIIWSESDVKRAEEGRIYIVTENELHYFEAFIRHMGTAGRYQILGEFLKGQKVPGMTEVKIPAIKGKIGGELFYSFVATPRALLKLAFVNHQALNHPDGKPAYQRMVSSKRIKDIGEFVVAGGFFPTNILLNFVNSPKFEPLSNKENTNDNVKFGWITLPSVYRSAWVIDGQHRLYGYSGLEEKYLDESLFVLAFDGMDTHKEADLFININHKQKSVPKGLLVSLLADIRMGDSDPKTALSALGSSIVRTLNTDKTSPLYRKFVVNGVSQELGQHLTISEAVSGISRSTLVGRAVGKNRVPGPLSAGTDDATIIRAKNVLNLYFEAIRSSNPDRWELGRAGYICTNPGIRAHLMLVAEIVRYLTHKGAVDFHALNDRKFGSLVVELAAPVLSFIEKAMDDEIADKFSRKFGEGGVKEYFYNLLQIINSEKADFGPPEFLEWLIKRDSVRVDEAVHFVNNLSELLVTQVVGTLKSVHGSRTLPSGDPAYWEIGIESRKIKDAAYRKQQEISPDQRQPREAYIDVADLEEVIKQKNNWDYFAPLFNLQMPDEKGGKKYYLSWLARYNELRRIATQKNSLRTYSDDELEFLDWLRAELMPKLEGEN